MSESGSNNAPQPYDGYRTKVCPILPATVENKELHPCFCLGSRCAWYVSVRNEQRVEIDGSCGIAMIATQVYMLPANYIGAVQQVTQAQSQVPVIKRV